MKQLFLLLLLLNFSTSFSQELVFKKMDIYQNDKKLSHTEIKEILSVDMNAIEYYKTANTKSTIGGFLLGFGIGFALTDAIIGGNKYNYTFPGTATYVGLGSIAISIPILSGREKLLIKSVDTYNQNNKLKSDQTENNLKLNIISNNNGFGIQFNF